MGSDEWGKRVALGAAAGLAGTLVIQGLLKASQKWMPTTLEPLRRDPGEFMVHQAEHLLPTKVQTRIGPKTEKAAAGSLGLGYGMAFGVLYSLLRPQARHRVLEGVALGVGCWAVGYLGWLPATGLMPPVWKFKPQQAAGSLGRHAAYGVAAVEAYDRLAARI